MTSHLPNPFEFNSVESSPADALTVAVDDAPKPKAATVFSFSRSLKPAESIDPDQSAAGGVLIPSMATQQLGEFEAGETDAASAWASRSPALRAPVEPAAVKVGCGQAPEFNSNTSEASGTTRKVPSGSFSGEPSVLQSSDRKPVGVSDAAGEAEHSSRLVSSSRFMLDVDAFMAAIDPRNISRDIALRSLASNSSVSFSRA